jgi:hypothetical protein
MERYEAEDIACGRIWHVDALLRRDPLWHNGASNGTEKTLLNELLQPLLGCEGAALRLHRQCSGGHEIGGDGVTTARVVYCLFFSLSLLWFSLFTTIVQEQGRQEQMAK